MARSIAAFGELLLRLDAPGHDRLVQAELFKARYSGAEANVAVSLAHFGWEAFAVSKVPAHEIGQACINFLRRYGVRADHVLRGGERLGLLYVEAGASQRPSKVIYDRSGSSFLAARPEEFDWDRILAGKGWLHFSGTVLAQGPHLRRILEDGIRAARRLGVRVSCDVNYRSKLSSPEEAGRALGSLLEGADVLVGGSWDPERIFGIRPREGLPREEACAEQAAALIRRFGLRHVALTLRSGSSASSGRLAGLLHDGREARVSREHEMQFVDRIGGGDAFTAGILHGIESAWEPQRAIEFAAAASSLKHSIPGDFNLVSEEEVDALLEGEDGSRVGR